MAKVKLEELNYGDVFDMTVTEQVQTWVGSQEVGTVLRGVAMNDAESVVVTRDGISWALNTSYFTEPVYVEKLAVLGAKDMSGTLHVAPEAGDPELNMMQTVVQFLAGHDNVARRVLTYLSDRFNLTENR